jgi:hypothetical protein
MLSCANVMQLFAYKFAGLGAGRLPQFFIFFRAPNYFLFGHFAPASWSEQKLAAKGNFQAGQTAKPRPGYRVQSLPGAGT